MREKDVVEKRKGGRVSVRKRGSLVERI